MRQRTLRRLLTIGILALASILALSLRRTKEAPAESRGYCLDSWANCYWLVDRALGLPFRRLTVRLAGIKEGDSVLDIGCGPGTLTLLEKEKAGRLGYVAGVDIGPRMIDKAKEKATQSGIDVGFRVASIDDLPFADNTFDVVTSSFMVHHLPAEVKPAGFSEVYRVLKPGGRYLIVDFPRARGLIGKVSLALTRLFSPFFEELNDSLDLLEGRVPPMLRYAGFDDVEELGSARIGGVFPVDFVGAEKSGKRLER